MSVMSCMTGQCKMCNIARNRSRKRFYWGNFQGKGSKIRHKYPDLSTKRHAKGKHRDTAWPLLLLVVGQTWEQSHQGGDRLWCQDPRLSGKAGRPASGAPEAQDGPAAPLFSSSDSCLLERPAESRITFGHFCLSLLPHFKMLFAGSSRYYFS